MSGKKISEMTAITGAQLDQVNDVLPVLDVSDTTNPNKKISIQELASVIGASGTTNVDLSLDSSNNLTLTDSDNNTVTVDLSSLDNSSLTLADVTANGADTVNSDLTISRDGFNPALLLSRTGTNTGSSSISVGNGGRLQISSSSNIRLGNKTTIGSISTTPSVTLDIQGTDAVQLTSGTTAQRPVSPANGMIRYNSDDDVFEGYAGDWGAIAKFDGDLLKSRASNTESLEFGAGFFSFKTSATSSVRFNTGSLLTFLDGVFSHNLGRVNNSFLGNIAIGTISSPTVTLDIQGTDAVQLTAGTTAERPTAAAGMIRFNTDTSKFEGYDGTAWIDLN